MKTVITAAWTALSKRVPVLAGLVKFIGYAIACAVVIPTALVAYATVFVLLCLASPPVYFLEGLACLGTPEGAWNPLSRYVPWSDHPVNLHWTTRLVLRLKRFAVAVYGKNSDDSDGGLTGFACFWGFWTYLAAAAILVPYFLRGMVTP